MRTSPGPICVQNGCWPDVEPAALEVEPERGGHAVGEQLLAVDRELARQHVRGAGAGGRAATSTSGTSCASSCANSAVSRSVVIPGS